MSTGLVFGCLRCGSQIDVAPDDDVPEVTVKFKRVEVACRACGHTVNGLDAPGECPSDTCPDPERGWQSAEQVVTKAVSVAICSECQADSSDGDVRELLTSEL